MKFYVRDGGRSGFQGPMSTAEIRSALAAGRLSPDCEVVEATGQSAFELSGSAAWRSVTELGIAPVSLPSKLGRATAAQCAQCGSERVIPRAFVWGQGEQALGNLQAYVYAKPDAMFFKEAVYTTLYARICGECGHASLFADGAEALYETYQRSQSGR
ncbi:MAG: hypothetical protein AB7O38_17000 [Pirellulaceae bacterium]